MVQISKCPAPVSLRNLKSQIVRFSWQNIYGTLHLQRATARTTARELLAPPVTDNQSPVTLSSWPLRRAEEKTLASLDRGQCDLDLFRSEEYIVGGIGCALFLAGMRGITAGCVGFAALRVDALYGCD